MVATIAVLARSSVENVPKPWLRYVVGIMLTSFGTFWSSQGIGVRWPASDVSIFGILVVYIAVSSTYIWLIRGRRFPNVPTQASTEG